LFDVVIYDDDILRIATVKKSINFQENRDLKTVFARLGVPEDMTVVNIKSYQSCDEQLNLYGFQINKLSEDTFDVTSCCSVVDGKPGRVLIENDDVIVDFLTYILDHFPDINKQITTAEDD
jgi:hypothetical protein